MSSRSLKPIEGLRFIFNFWVVWLHVYQLFTYSFNQQLENVSILQKSYYAGAIRGFGFQVDGFFLISGFLTARSCLASISETDSFLLLPWRVTLFVLKRFIRLWPAMVFTFIVALILTDIGLQPLGESLVRTFLFQVDEHETPMAFVVTWSNFVDIVCSVLLLVAISLFSRVWKSRNGFAVAVALAVASTFPSIFVHLFSHDPPISILTTMKLRNNHILLSMIHKRCEWLKHRFNIESIASENDVVRSAFAHGMYLPWYTRMPPFFFGLALAVKIYSDSKKQKGVEPTTAAVSVARQGNGKAVGWIHYLLTILTVSVYSFPAVLGIVSARAAAPAGSATTAPAPPDTAVAVAIKAAIDLLLTALIRPIFGAATGYLLYRVMLPSDDPLALPVLARFLSADFFQLMGPLTYTIYVLHYRVMLEIIYGVLPFSFLQQYLGPRPGLAYIATYAMVTFIPCALVAVVVVQFVEKPFVAWGYSILSQLTDSGAKAKKA